jgi:FKBP12-rapamycin complex-associated protein
LFFTDRQEEATTRLENLCEVVDMVSQCENVANSALRVSCWVELGEWKMAGAVSPDALITEHMQVEILTAFKRATLLDDCGYRAWHDWALFNFRIALQISESDDENGNRSRSGKLQRNHVVSAVKGFVNAISLGTKRESASVQQDLLNLLTCLFKYGDLQDVAVVINECIGSVAVEAWLGVLPQLLARIHIKEAAIRAVLHPLLTRLGEKHPQALMYPLSVLLKSPVAERKSSAESLMTTLKEHSSALVEEALMVSSELIRVAILWLETWHEGLEDASRLYFVEGNVSGMLDILLPLHETVEAGAVTLLENDFLKNFGEDLAMAHRHIKEYIRIVTEGGSSIPTGPTNRHSRQSEEAEAAMNRAWGTFYRYLLDGNLLTFLFSGRYLLHFLPKGK